MSIIIDLLKQHPWLPSLKEVYSDIFSVDSIKKLLINDDRKNLQKRIFNFFNVAFEDLEYFSDYRPDDNNIYLYILIKILLDLLDNKSISNRIANLYSKTVYDELNKEGDFNLFSIYNDLNLNVKYEENPIVFKEIIIKELRESYSTHFKMHFTDYLEYSSYLRDDHRKLINNSLHKGYVYLKPQKLNRLIQEYVRNKLLSGTLGDKLKKEFLNINEIESLIELIQSIWDLKKVSIEHSFDVEFKKGEDFSQFFPPCMNEILSKAKEGQNLQHNERLVILFFLFALNYPEEYIINIYSTLPDFNKEKTTYQVNFAKKKGYSPHGCSTLKSLQLCMASKYKDTLCLEGFYSKKLNTQKKINHPLFYVQFKRNTMKKKNNNDKNKNIKKNE